MSSAPPIARARAMGVKLATARAVGTVVRRTGRGGGTSLPGKILTRLEPHAISQLSSKLSLGTAVISATNGKTTTAAMAATILGRRGIRLVHNRAGANMAGGIATSLAQAARRRGQELDADFGLFEVDEFWLPPMVAQLQPRAMLLGNLFRDQLDRYGELDTIAERWAKLVASQAGKCALIACADDPAIAALATNSPDTIYYGIEDDRVAYSEPQHASDAKHCNGCGTAYAYDAAYFAHLGRWYCPACGVKRPEPQVVAGDIKLNGIRSASFTLSTPHGAGRVDLPLPGLYNVYNAVGAAAMCLALGVELEAVLDGLAAVEPAFGRAESMVLNGHDASILLIKNPAGANEVLRTLALEGNQLDILGMLNDGVADGRDVSWIWDVDWELLAPKVRRMICSGTRAAELALRMKHAGVDPHRLRVDPDITHALDSAVGSGDRSIYILPTYTALLQLHQTLSNRGHAKDFWK